MSEEKKPHPAACPCPQCRKSSEQATSHLEPTNPDNSRLKKLSPEAARTLGYVPKDS